MEVATLSADPEAIHILSFASNSDSITILAQTSQTFGVFRFAAAIPGVFTATTFAD
jgi:hypothetical protein